MTQAYVCPVDQSPLVISERQGIEIDYCPTCRGVWLDRGELDKIIEKGAAVQPAAQQPQQPQQQFDQWATPRHSDHHGYGYRPHKRRKSFLEDLFD